MAQENKVTSCRFTNSSVMWFLSTLMFRHISKTNVLCRAKPISVHLVWGYAHGLTCYSAHKWSLLFHMKKLLEIDLGVPAISQSTSSQKCSQVGCRSTTLLYHIGSYFCMFSLSLWVKDEYFFKLSFPTLGFRVRVYIMIWLHIFSKRYS